jgi:hypothetical protein
MLAPAEMCCATSRQQRPCLRLRVISKEPGSVGGKNFTLSVVAAPQGQFSLRKAHERGAHPSLARMTKPSLDIGCATLVKRHPYTTGEKRRHELGTFCSRHHSEERIPTADTRKLQASGVKIADEFRL